MTTSLKNFFVSKKTTIASPKEKDGQAGYEIEYLDGYKSWCPEKTFERDYIKAGEFQDDIRDYPILLSLATEVAQLSYDIKTKTAYYETIRLKGHDSYDLECLKKQIDAMMSLHISTSNRFEYMYSLYKTGCLKKDTQ